MGNEAWEKAVEAGARAGSPAAFDAENFVGIPHRREVAERFARESAERTLRAAFPILAEEFAQIADEQNHAAIAAGIAAHSKANQHFNIGRSDAAIEIAKRLRAHIEQMREPS
ncbi:hypothetical protein [Kaistia adipata]|uniref:hypothetical protein n=1 Tax=Kaistia adipata TaxID=166954 RepID=UPI0012EBF069|nr:hypothetical protein [Kaistia adipata]